MRPADPPDPPPPRPGQEDVYSDPEQVARRFIEAYGSFDWRDPDPRAAVRERTRPWATARLNEFLDTGSSAAFLTQQRIEVQELRTIEIVFIDPISPKGPDLATFLALSRPHVTSNNSDQKSYEAFFELTVIRVNGKWLVDRMLV